MGEYFFPGILSESVAQNKNTQNFKSNGHDIDFKTIVMQIPLAPKEAPSNYHPNLYYEDHGVAVLRRPSSGATRPRPSLALIA